MQRCELPNLMLMLALLSIGLLALRCMDALAPLFISELIRVMADALLRAGRLRR